MDSDRKSTVSSFYGGRKGSLDALNQDFNAPAPAGRTHDDASSFFNPDRNSRGSIDLLAGPPPGAMRNAGYNRGEFFHAGREEPLKGGRDEEEVPDTADWDVYADFNNVGPRYSSALGLGAEAGYQSLSGGATPKAEEPSGPVEMVTVPALGPEWGKAEMRDMTKGGRRERQAETRRRIWRDWTQGRRGGKWFTRRFIVFGCFGLIAVIAIVIGICIPRVPSFALSNDTPLVNATGPFASEVRTLFSAAPANFSFPAFANLQVDTTGNYLPLSFKHLRAQVFDLDSGFLVATGDLGRKTLPAKSLPDIQLPLTFSYVATNNSDTTWNNWHKACENRILFTGGQRPSVRFRLLLDMVIIGLPGSYKSSTQVNNANCPIELPSTSA